MGRSYRIWVEDGDNEGAGCAGCLLLAGAAVVLLLAASYGSVLYRRYTVQQEEARRVPLSQDVLDSYMGQYDYGRYLITVERQGDKLFTKSVEERCELMPVSQSAFIFRNCVNGFGGQAVFSRDSRGQVTMMITYRDGRTERVVKKE